MPDRKMFWRIIRRLLAANRGRLVVILLALGAGAAITAALLNLQVDAKRRITTEFRAFGPNILITPPAAQSSAASSATLDEEIVSRLPGILPPGDITGVASLYLVAAASTKGGQSSQAVVAGVQPLEFFPLGVTADADARSRNYRVCSVGSRVAAQLHLRENDDLVLRNADREESCRIFLAAATGGPEDNQVFPRLGIAQRLTGMPNRISLIQIRVAGTPQHVNDYLSDLRRRLPDADVRPIRQFTEGEAKIYDRISGILSATVGLVLLLTALCVMAAMTNVAMERRNDVGLMKAIGGATRRVLRLFLAEAALLGLTGGVLGAAVGILLSMWLGKAVFGVAARPRLIVYPVAVALTIIVAIAGAYPLRRLANIRPAAVFRGEA